MVSDNSMKSNSELLIYLLTSQGPMTTGAIADALVIDKRAAGWAAARACAAGDAVRMVRACRGREAVFGPPGNADHDTTIRAKILAVLARSDVMHSANSMALAVNAKRDTVAHHLIDMVHRGEAVSANRGHHVFYGRDADCRVPTVARRAKPKPAPAPAKTKPPVIKRPPPAPVPVVPVSAPAGSIRYGSYIGAAPSRAPWLDFTGWPEPSGPFVNRARGGESPL